MKKILLLDAISFQVDPNDEIWRYENVAQIKYEKGELKNHRLATEILYHICVQEILYKNGNNETLTFSLNNLI